MSLKTRATSFIRRSASALEPELGHAVESLVTDLGQAVTEAVRADPKLGPLLDGDGAAGRAWAELQTQLVEGGSHVDDYRLQRSFKELESAVTEALGPTAGARIGAIAKRLLSLQQAE